MRRVSHNTGHMNTWPPVGGALWKGLVVQPCWRECATGSQLALSLCFMLVFEEMSIQLTMPADWCRAIPATMDSHPSGTLSPNQFLLLQVAFIIATEK